MWGEEGQAQGRYPFGAPLGRLSSDTVLLPQPAEPQARARGWSLVLLQPCLAQPGLLWELPSLGWGHRTHTGAVGNLRGR